MAEEVILETEGLSKEFRGFYAVKDVALRVRRGAIHALIGPNGAGKTTCFNLLTKFLEPTRGRILYEGRDITATKPSDIAKMGLVRSFQISAVFGHLTALENVRVALQRGRGESFDFWRSERVLDRHNARALELLEAVGIAEFAHTPAGELAYGRKRALEIATTIALDPKLMLLDEPTAGMSPEETRTMMDLIVKLARERTVILVEHKMKLVLGISDRILVLHHGELLAEGTPQEVRQNEAVKRVYLGQREH